MRHASRAGQKGVLSKPVNLPFYRASVVELESSTSNVVHCQLFFWGNPALAAPASYHIGTPITRLHSRLIVASLIPVSSHSLRSAPPSSPPIRWTLSAYVPGPESPEPAPTNLLRLRFCLLHGELDAPVGRSVLRRHFIRTSYDYQCQHPQLPAFRGRFLGFLILPRPPVVYRRPAECKVFVRTRSPVTIFVY